MGPEKKLKPATRSWQHISHCSLNMVTFDIKYVINHKMWEKAAGEAQTRKIKRLGNPCYLPVSGWKK
jgi:hypothetical protein